MEERNFSIDYHKFFNKKILIIGLIIFCTLVVIYLFSPFFNLNKIVILGNSHLTVEQVVSKGEIDTTKNIYLINDRKIIEKLKNDHYIQNVSIKKHFPRQLDIEINVRQPIASINLSGKFAIIDVDGNILKLEPNFANTVNPLILGMDELKVRAGQHLDMSEGKPKQLMELIKSVQSLGILQSLIQINMADPNNISLKTTQGIIILLGKGEGVNSKLLRLNQILVDLQTKGINSGYVDMRFDANPVYRPQ